MNFRYIFLAFLIIASAFICRSAQAQWVQTNGPSGWNVVSFAVSGANVFAGTVGGGVFLTSDNGAHWNAVNNGLTDMNVWALAVSGANVFAGIADTGGVWRRPLVELISTVNESPALPLLLALSAYPNPFSSKTTILFSSGARIRSLKIYDALGRQVEDLTAKIGGGTVSFDGSGLPAGVYVARAVGENSVEENVMVLVK